MPTRRETLEKQPSESFPIEMNFRQTIPLGATELVSSEASAIKWPRRQPTNTSTATLEILTSSTGIIVPDKCGGPNVKCRFNLTGGTDDYDYKLTILATFDDGSVLEEELFVRVRDR